MRVIYDPETDTLSIILSSAAVAESDEDKPVIILDYDESGNLVSLETLDASRRVASPHQMDFQVTPQPS